MGCAPFANHHFQMGVTAMGFVEDLGHYLLSKNLLLRSFNPKAIDKRKNKTEHIVLSYVKINEFCFRVLLIWGIGL